MIGRLFWFDAALMDGEGKMETLEIQSSHDLTTRSLAARRAGSHSYRINCRQFLTLERDWRRTRQEQEAPLGLMTLGFDRIWISKAEAEQVEGAILARSSPLTLE